MSVIESSPTRTASEGHATVGAAAMLRLVPRRPVKWGSDLFVDKRYAIARGQSLSFLPLAGGKRSATTGGSWRESQKGMERRGRTPQNVRSRDRIGVQRRKQSKHSATPPRGDSPWFLATWVPGGSTQTPPGQLYHHPRGCQTDQNHSNV